MAKDKKLKSEIVDEIRSALSVWANQGFSETVLIDRCTKHAIECLELPRNVTYSWYEELDPDSFYLYAADYRVLRNEMKKEIAKTMHVWEGHNLPQSTIVNMCANQIIAILQFPGTSSWYEQ